MPTAKTVKKTKTTRPAKPESKAATAKTKPKKLSKAGEWMRAHPNGVEVIYIDWKAVLR